MGQRDPTRGVATVTVDGGQTFSVDLHGVSTPISRDSGTPGSSLRARTPSRSNGRPVSAPLAAGRCRGRGRVPGGGHGDAGLRVAPRPGQRPPRALLGHVDANPVFQASGGSDKRAGAGQAMVTVTFTGKQLDWLATTGPGLGDADVSIDSGRRRSSICLERPLSISRRSGPPARWPRGRTRSRSRGTRMQPRERPSTSTRSTCSASCRPPPTRPPCGPCGPSRSSRTSRTGRGRSTAWSIVRRGAPSWPSRSGRDCRGTGSSPTRSSPGF